MLRYKAGYKYVESGVHAQVVDFPAAITCAHDLSEAAEGKKGQESSQLI